MRGIRMHLEYSVVSDRYDLYVLQEDNGIYRQVRPVVYEPYEPGDAVLPAISIPVAGAACLEQLGRDLKHAGLIDGKDLSAQGKHLEDMRALAFAALKIERPNNASA